MSPQPFIIAAVDETTGVIFQGTVVADSEIEARERIKLTIERMFLGTQTTRYDRVPEPLRAVIQAQHDMIGQLGISPDQLGYTISNDDLDHGS